MSDHVVTLRAEPSLLAALDQPGGPWAPLGPTLTISHRVRQVLARWRDTGGWPCEAEQPKAPTGRRTVHLDGATSLVLTKLTEEWKVSYSAALRLVLLGYLAQVGDIAQVGDPTPAEPAK